MIDFFLVRGGGGTRGGRVSRAHVCAPDLNKNLVGVPPTTPKAHQRARGKKDLKQTITDRIISLMEEGPEAWQKTWKDAAAAGRSEERRVGKEWRGRTKG